MAGTVESGSSGLNPNEQPAESSLEIKSPVTLESLAADVLAMRQEMALLRTDVQSSLSNSIGETAVGLGSQQNIVFERVNTVDINTEALFLQTWYRFSPNQKARIFPLLENTRPTEEDLEGLAELSVPQATILLGVSQGRIRTLIHEGKLSAERDDRNNYRISRESIDAFLARRSERAEE